MDRRTLVYGHRLGERARIARAAGISPTYLYMLCVGLRPMDSVDLARRIEAATDGRIPWDSWFQDPSAAA